MKPSALTFKAGNGAVEAVRKHGFDLSCIGTLAGASGGAKWLVLSQLDRYIVKNLVPQLSGPVHLLGTSIGSWRFACYAQNDPLAAIERFETSYIEQQFSSQPDIREITEKSREILDVVLGENGTAEILSHPVLRTHIMAVRSRHVLASENRLLLGSGLLAAASLNLAFRKSLGLFFERALFFDARERPPFFDLTGFPIQQVSLQADNLTDAIVATGSIPLVLSGVRDIAGARPGIYRDGGVIDYHHDLPQSAAGRFTLYPHFYSHIVPGWFDKRLRWRRPAAANVDRTILISPSDAFVASLPNARIPDRQDFVRYSPQQRVKVWRDCVVACEQLADELHEVLENDQLAARLERL